MKKMFVLATLALVVSAAAMAQKPFELSTVIKQDSMDAKALYEATRNWFVESFKDSKAVIKDENPGKQITGKGTIEFSVGSMVYLSINGYIEFLIDAQFRDGRLKLTMRNFSHRAAKPAMYDNNMSILVDSLPKNLEDIGVTGSRKKMYQYYFKQGKPLCQETFAKVVASLTEFLKNRKAEAEEDW